MKPDKGADVLEENVEDRDQRGGEVVGVRIFL